MPRTSDQACPCERSPGFSASWSAVFFLSPALPSPAPEARKMISQPNIISPRRHEVHEEERGKEAFGSRDFPSCQVKRFGLAPNYLRASRVKNQEDGMPRVIQRPCNATHNLLSSLRVLRAFVVKIFFVVHTAITARGAVNGYKNGNTLAV